MPPLISVIIPTHNDGATIDKAIRSILDQTYSNLEIIIVDDHSTDDTERIVFDLAQKYNNIQYHKLPFDDPNRSVTYKGKTINVNAGYMARNYGVDQANGEWITFQDADDASLLNRIEVQYEAAREYGSNHVCIDWVKFEVRLIGNKLDIDRFKADHSEYLVSKKEIDLLVRETKGPLFILLGPLHTYVPFFSVKIRKPFQRFFFREWDPYPCAGNSPLVKREVFEKVRFRPYTERVWPSRRGRGADRDFNFQVAETFKSSICLKLPLYLW